MRDNTYFEQAYFSAPELLVDDMGDSSFAFTRVLSDDSNGEKFQCSQTRLNPEVCDSIDTIDKTQTR
jgi:hypothetical protein